MRWGKKMRGLAFQADKSNDIDIFFNALNKDKDKRKSKAKKARKDRKRNR